MIHYGLIGTNQATDDFVQAASVTNKWELGALYASDVDQADQYAKKYGTDQTFFDIADFFKNGNFDTVFIASPNGDHFSHIKQAIQADKHVIVQPPALTNPTEFAEVEQLLTDHPRALFFEGAYPIHMPNFKNIETAVEKMAMIQGLLWLRCGNNRNMMPFWKEPNLKDLLWHPVVARCSKKAFTPFMQL